MTTDIQEEMQRHKAVAQTLRDTFFDACDKLNELLAAHNGVLPRVQESDNAARRKEIAAIDEAVVEVTSTLFGAVRALHTKIGETHLFIANDNPYRFQCRAAHYKLQGILFAYQGLYLGAYHDNLREAADQFVHKLDLSNAAPFSKIPRKIVKPKPEKKPEVKAARPKRRPGQGRASIGSSSPSCIPQYT